MINIAIIGYGYWGPNLVRNFMLTDGASVTAVCDGSADRRAAAAVPPRRSTGCRATSSG